MNIEAQLLEFATTTAHYRLADGILFCEPRVTDRVLKKHIHEDAKTLERYFQGIKYPVLVEIREFSPIDKEAIVAVAEMAKNHFSAMGIVTNSIAARMIVNFIFGLMKYKLPRRIFTTKAEAITWIRTVRSNCS